jgi:hypothetical protein
MFEATGKPLRNCDTNALAQYALVPTAVHDQLHLAIRMVKQLSHGFLCCRRCARQLGVARDALQLTKNGAICAQFVNPNAILHDIIILNEVRVGGSDWMGKRWGWWQAFLSSHFVCVHLRQLHPSGGWRRHIGVERPSDCVQATGMEAQGDPTEEFSWFPGYSWEYLHCDCCGTHIGWLYRWVCVCVWGGTWHVVVKFMVWRQGFLAAARAPGVLLCQWCYTMARALRAAPAASSCRAQGEVVGPPGFVGLRRECLRSLTQEQVDWCINRFL